MKILRKYYHFPNLSKWIPPIVFSLSLLIFHDLDILDETPQEIQNLETELVVFKSLEEGLAKISKKVLELMVKTKEEDEYYEDWLYKKKFDTTINSIYHYSFEGGYNKICVYISLWCNIIDLNFHFSSY